jgi:hypothetical protein
MLPQEHLNEQIPAVVQHAVADAARGVLSQQSCGKRKSISRDTSPGSGGAEADIGSEDLDVEAYTQEDSGGGKGEQRNRRGRWRQATRITHARREEGGP